MVVSSFEFLMNSICNGCDAAGAAFDRQRRMDLEVIETRAADARLADHDSVVASISTIQTLKQLSFIYG